jgi:hypothetical protein
VEPRVLCLELRRRAPVLKEYDEGSAQPVTLAIEADSRQAHSGRFGTRMVKLIKAIHQVEQKRSAAVRTLKMRFPDTISLR